MKRIAPNHYPVVQSLITNGTIRKKEISMAIGAAIGLNLAQPGQKVTTPGSYFQGTHGAVSDDFLSALNNIAPIDFATAREFAEKFYRLRHAQIFGTELYTKTTNAIYDKLGYTSIFNEGDIAIIATNNNQFNYNLISFEIMFKEFTA